MRASRSGNAVGNARLASLSCCSIHSGLPLGHHGSGEVLRRKLAGLLGCQVRVFEPELRVQLVKLRGNAGRQLRRHSRSSRTAVRCSCLHMLSVRGRRR